MKTVGITEASRQAEEIEVYAVKRLGQIKSGWKAKQMLIDAEARKDAAAKQAKQEEFLQMHRQNEEATIGLSEAEVMMAAAAVERQGIVKRM